MSENWSDLLQRAERCNTAGRTDEALALIDRLFAENANDRDATGWGLFSKLKMLLETGRQEEAAALAEQIIPLGINLPSKIFACLAAIDVWRKDGRREKAGQLLIRIDELLGTLPTDRPISSDDINIRVGMDIVQLASACGFQDRLVNIGTFYPEADHPAIDTIRGPGLRLRAPEMYNFEPPQFEDLRRRTRSPAPGLSFRLAKDVTILKHGNTLLGFDADMSLLPLFFDAFPKYYEQPLEVLARSKREQAVHLSGRTLSVCDTLHDLHNYCHWIYDYLPRILTARKLNLSFERILLPFAIEHEYQSATLGSEPCVCISPGEVYFCDELVYADDFGGNSRQPIYDWNPYMVAILKEALQVRDFGEDLKLYVPRAQTRMRHVVNDAELWTLLSKYGYSRIDTDSLPFEEQIKAFQRASHVVAPHGAALTNLFHCRPETSVLEIFPRFGGAPCFWAVACALNLRYSCLVDSDEARLPGSLHINSAHMNADLDFVERWLAAN